MPVPYGKRSKAKGRQRRAANMKYVGVNVQKCPSCGERLPTRGSASHCHGCGAPLD